MRFLCVAVEDFNGRLGGNLLIPWRSGYTRILMQPKTATVERQGRSFAGDGPKYSNALMVHGLLGSHLKPVTITVTHLLAYVTGLVNQELLLKNEYLLAEKCILKAHLRPGFRLSPPERITLAEIGKRLGRKLLRQVLTSLSPTPFPAV